MSFRSYETFDKSLKVNISSSAAPEKCYWEDISTALNVALNTSEAKPMIIDLGLSGKVENQVYERQVSFGCAWHKQHDWGKVERKGIVILSEPPWSGEMNSERFSQVATYSSNIAIQKCARIVGGQQTGKALRVFVDDLRMPSKQEGTFAKLGGKLVFYDAKNLSKKVFIKSDKSVGPAKADLVSHDVRVGPASPLEGNYEHLLGKYHELIDASLSRQLSPEQEHQLSRLEDELATYEKKDLDVLKQHDQRFDNSDEVRELRKLNSRLQQLLSQRAL